MNKKYIILITAVCFFVKNIFAQADTTRWLNNFLTPSQEFSKKKLTLVLGTEATLYTGATLALYQFWYKDYPLVKFHFFNDNGEWLQHDKAGHFYTAYFETNITTGFYEWTGMKKENAYWAGAVTGSLLQLTIEVFDGFSEKWGFSVGDFTANTLGAGLSVSQNYLWNEQRIRIKYSAHRVNYPDTSLSQRVKDLFGTSAIERGLKDYNGSTYWLSVNPSLFMKPDTKFPKWLMISGGYGIQNVFGGYENKWCPSPDVKPEDCPPELLTDRSDIERLRQYYFSFDVDLSQIETNSQIINRILDVLNVFKFPAPAIEFNSDGSAKFYFLYF